MAGAHLVVQLQRRLRKAEHALLFGHLHTTTRQMHEISVNTAPSLQRVWVIVDYRGRHACQECTGMLQRRTLGACVTCASSCATAAAAASPAHTAGS